MVAGEASVHVPLKYTINLDHCITTKENIGITMTMVDSHTGMMYVTH